MVRHTSKFGRDKRKPNVTNHSSLLPSKRKRDNNDAWLSQIDPRKVMELVNFKSLGWILDNKKKDYISQLPDDILMKILSHLTKEERARTNMLSTRWRDMLIFASGILDFNNSRTVKEIHRYVGKELSIERQWFVKYVNRILESHQDQIIEELKICFDVNNAIYTRDINVWIKFAIQKGVKRFHLDLTSAETNYGWEYIFPSNFLSSSTSISLMALHLKYVQVTGEVIKNILCTCPLLEVLSVTNSSILKNLKVCDPSLKLKYLEINCDNVENIEVSKINLVSFKYCGRKLDMTLVDLPSLAEVSFGGHYGKYLVEHKFQDISRHLSQLETLKLDLGFEMVFRYQNFPELCKLKQLHLTVYAFNANSLLSCISLIEASPLLHRFSLQFERSSKEKRSIVGQKVVKRHQSLKVVELIGFKGLTYDLVLAKYLVEYAKLLEKIIIGPHKGDQWGWISFDDTVKMDRARQELKSILPPTAKLVIL